MGVKTLLLLLGPSSSGAITNKEEGSRRRQPKVAPKVLPGGLDGEVWYLPLLSDKPIFVLHIITRFTNDWRERYISGKFSCNWEAHKPAIQAFIKMTLGELVRGSSDTTIILWRGKTCTHTSVGHRGL
nr:uncharacterized protein LOC107426656 [Ziziphus jujuba var. spinosa]